MTENFPSAALVANLCLEKFKTLPKTGKPKPDEWTVLAGIVQHISEGPNATASSSRVVALGTGTKCIGQQKLCRHGLILNDSHAEVLARRAFLRYVYHQLKIALSFDQGTKESSGFTWDQDKQCFQLRPSVSFHFFSSQTPCGDACIRDETNALKRERPNAGDSDGDDEGPPRKSLKIDSSLKTNDHDGDCVGRILPSASETVFTGAKLLGAQHSDRMQQVLGAVRTKPGRGDRTLSMSCSDKLAKWNVMGVQGALLQAVLDRPVYFQTLDFCSADSNDDEPLRRAIYERWQHLRYSCGIFKPQKPAIRSCSPAVRFPHDQQAERVKPSPNGLVWSDLPDDHRPYEISVNGKRQGVTSQKLNTPSAALRISKFFMLKNFIDLIDSHTYLLNKFHLERRLLRDMNYLQFKQLAGEYQEAWLTTKAEYFQQWTKKNPELLQFSIGDVEDRS